MARKSKEVSANIKAVLDGMNAESQPEEIVTEGNSGSFLRKLEFKQLKYDYDIVDETYRDTLKDAAVDINQRRRRTIEDVITIGRRLYEISHIVSAEFFEAWCSTEFNYTVKTANEFIAIFERFGADPAQLMGYGVSIARLLAAPSVPQEAVDYVLGQAHAGDPLTIVEAEEVIDEFRPDAEKKSARIERNPRMVQGTYTVEESHDEPEAPEEDQDHLDPVVATLLTAPDSSTVLPYTVQHASLEQLQQAVASLPEDESERRPVLEHAIQHYEKVHIEKPEPAISMRKKLTGKVSIELPRKLWAQLADAIEAFDLNPIISDQESANLLSIIRKSL